MDLILVLKSPLIIALLIIVSIGAGLLCLSRVIRPKKAIRTLPKDHSEIEFKNVFFNKAAADRERIVSYRMRRGQCGRSEAMRLAVEE
jgi:hypothetical protein